VIGTRVAITDLLSFGGVTVLVLLFCAHFLVLEAVFLSYARRSASRGQLKRRLATGDSAQEQQQVLSRMRQKRSVLANDHRVLPLAWLNRLIVQSGVQWGVAWFPAIFMGISAAVSLPVLLFTGHLVVAVVAGLLGGAGLLVFFLISVRNRRHRKLQDQLPEATDILVRSLRAGHPVASAIRLVAHDLPDPIGTEFAIVADEMTYGLDLETAMENLGSRVDQKDLALIVTATRIQTSTGGNLAEILACMSKSVRESLKVRMKVKALSAEGRWSAIILSILPFALFSVLTVIAPTFYGDVWDEPIVKVVLTASAAWLALGNVIMFRMVRFEV
jgi:tight adherence protein B